MPDRWRELRWFLHPAVFPFGVAIGAPAHVPAEEVEDALASVGFTPPASPTGRRLLGTYGLVAVPTTRVVVHAPAPWLLDCTAPAALVACSDGTWRPWPRVVSAHTNGNLPGDSEPLWIVPPGTCLRDVFAACARGPWTAGRRYALGAGARRVGIPYIEMTVKLRELVRPDSRLARRGMIVDAPVLRPFRRASG